jgi:dihydroorotate dehydrogenase (fumarate)
MDLTTRYLGLNLRTPLVPSASPLSDDLDNIKRMEDAGASAVVLHSLFEEQVTSERNEVRHDLMYAADSFPDAFHFPPNREILSPVRRNISIRSGRPRHRCIFLL